MLISLWHAHIQDIRTGGGTENQIVTRKKNKLITVANIVINLTILAIFKYFNFFVSSFARIFSLDADSLTLNIILPVGISFYTFQALSYTIDVYKGKIQPTTDILAFFAYISFFPQLVAGPIERATNLLPQFLKQRHFDYSYAIDGSRQILWGLFKKMVVADNCAAFANSVFNGGGSGSDHIIAAIFFAFQIYGDFSGYSDIAIGTAKLFGIRLMRNFNNPYFSRDIAEFWRRWHISLTTWFRDYIYIPLGGSRVGKSKVIRNTFIIFLVSGLWHGANWTFLLWGFYHACLFLPLILLGKNRKYTNTVANDKPLPSLKETAQMLFIFALVVIGWIIFRVTGIHSLIAYLKDCCSPESITSIYKIFSHPESTIPIIIMLIIEWFSRNKEHSLQNIEQLPALHNRYIRYIAFTLAFSLILFFRGGATDFIYFQF